MKIHLVTAEHYSNPGLIQKAFANAEAANAEAADLVNLMRKDTGWDCRTMAGPTSWEVFLLELQDYHGAAHCYVEITELEVAGSAFIDAALKIASAVAKAGTDDEGDMIVYADETGSVALLDAANAVESDVDAYLARFPAEHRATADRAYQDGFVDGAEAEPNLASVVKNALAYEASQFDGPSDQDLSVSGADLVDWFTAWRQEARAALTEIGIAA